MPSLPAPFLIGTKPGIKRDGTVFEGENYVDGQWVRFQRGLPRKMLGYRRLSTNVRGRVYGMNVFERNNLSYCHFGGQNGTLDRVAFQPNGVATGAADRTPGGLAAANDYVWQFDTIFNTAGTNTVVIAHPGRNLTDIVSSVASNIYMGDAVGTGAFASISGTNDVPSVAGGICVSNPYLFAYGDAGYITWSSPVQPTDFTTANGGGGAAGARVTSDKVLKGMPLRAGVGSAPAALFWSTNSLIRASFTGGVNVFQFDTVSTGITLVSSSCIVEYDGVYYWPGVDRFYKYTGVVDEMDNRLNNDWFFDNYNRTWRQKIFGFKVPRFGEIWWCYPHGNSTECNRAVIFNVRESRRMGFEVWYDTALPAGFRTAAAFAQLLGTPVVMDGVTYDSGSTYSVWQHETGYDEVGDSVQAIRSYVETSDISNMLLTEKNPSNAAIQATVMEPDFVQRGDLSVTFTGRVNARAPVNSEGPFVFGPDYEPSKGLVYPKMENRIFRMKIESNVAGGYYEFGQSLLQLNKGTERLT